MPVCGPPPAGTENKNITQVMLLEQGNLKLTPKPGVIEQGWTEKSLRQNQFRELPTG